MKAYTYSRGCFQNCISIRKIGKFSKSCFYDMIKKKLTCNINTKKK